MLWSWWRAVIAWDKFKYRTKFFVDSISMGQCFAMLKRNPSAYKKLEGDDEIGTKIYTLVFSITTLNLLM